MSPLPPDGWVPADPGEKATRSRETGRLAAVVDRVPPRIRAARMAPSARAVVGLAVVLLVGLLLAGWLLWRGRPSVEVVPVKRVLPVGASAQPSVTSAVSPGAATALQSPAAASTSTGATVVVHVAGAVRRPGVVTLAAGARVSDAVEAAGGAARRAELASVNLARLLVDGEQLVVLTRGTGAPGVVAAPGAGPAPPGGETATGDVGASSIDLNTATLVQLEGLPGVGPVLAQRILDWRTEHGRFSTVDELTEVSGIGDATLEEIRPGVRV